MTKRDLFFANKKRIEQAWNLLEVVGELINDIVDECDNSFSNSYDIYKTILEANDSLYETYEDNIKEHSEE
jgi:hypothetical protein|tara:strand:+ start:146 stop:358 length:213 start_codon:yes stop_codon:yes gene_type:complete